MAGTGRDLREGARFAEPGGDFGAAPYETGQLQRCALRLYAEDALARRLGVPVGMPGGVPAGMPAGLSAGAEWRAAAWPTQVPTLPSV
ncbi:hypothetical protein [Actinacidiphila sp. bgisy145]|uniref:hypothetical protein n=1 Tax=Actinacidiphila sp. bgisy145 TaxID=3413792 RepID=UPI003EB9ECF8